MCEGKVARTRYYTLLVRECLGQKEWKRYVKKGKDSSYQEESGGQLRGTRDRPFLSIRAEQAAQSLGRVVIHRTYVSMLPYQTVSVNIDHLMLARMFTATHITGMTLHSPDAQ